MNVDFYVTTTIPYANGKPHVGFALELVQADAIARYRRLLGDTVWFQTGTDENALKNVLAAGERGISTQELVDDYSQRFAELSRALDISRDDFIRTTENRYRRGVEHLWNNLNKKDLFQREYEALYCLGCEAFVQERELVDGNCPEHGAPPVHVSELNWFFRLSRYQYQISNLIKTDQIRIVPDKRKREVLSLVEDGLHDISVSRCAKRYSG